MRTSECLEGCTCFQGALHGLLSDVSVHDPGEGGTKVVHVGAVLPCLATHTPVLQTIPLLFSFSFFLPPGRKYQMTIHLVYFHFLMCPSEQAPLMAASDRPGTVAHMQWNK